MISLPRDPADFVRWADEVGVIDDYSCPLELYLLHLGAKYARVFHTAYETAGTGARLHTRRLPGWASRFVVEVDSRYRMPDGKWRLTGDTVGALVHLVTRKRPL